MNLKRIGSLLSISFLVCLVTLGLEGCRGSKDPALYSLNPAPFSAGFRQHQKPITIGIDAITIPEYIDHPQLMVFITPYQSKLFENDQWAEPIASNIQRVIQTNMAQKLPYAAVQLAPWDPNFIPELHLRVDITQLKVDKQGNSFLQAYFYLENKEKIVRHHQIQLVEKIPHVTPTTIVISLNRLLNQLSDNITLSIAKVT